jgi:hypothetical protein
MTGRRKEAAFLKKEKAEFNLRRNKLISGDTCAILFSLPK